MSQIQPTVREQEAYFNVYKEGHFKGLEQFFDHMKKCPQDLKKTICDFCHSKLIKEK